jgi:hypothetical protein
VRLSKHRFLAIHETLKLDFSVDSRCTQATAVYIDLSIDGRFYAYHLPRASLISLEVFCIDMEQVICQAPPNRPKTTT